jgi:hypothetical protein
MQRLNHVIAKAKDIKSATTAALSLVYKLNQKKDLFGGHTRRWSPAADDGRVYQDEDKIVQKRVEDVLVEAREQWEKAINSEATRDFANMTACADVAIGDTVIFEKAPVPFLLSLEKQLKDMAGFMAKLPELDPGQKWERDDDARLWRGQPRSSYKSRKVTEPVVVTEATDKHPAQWTEVTKDILEGTWMTTVLSGATTTSQKKQLLERVNTLREAVHVARENANMSEAPDKEIGKAVFNYVFGE